MVDKSILSAATLRNVRGSVYLETDRKDNIFYAQRASQYARAIEYLTLMVYAAQVRKGSIESTL